jgi:hypothetical protein
VNAHAAHTRMFFPSYSRPGAELRLAAPPRDGKVVLCGSLTSASCELLFRFQVRDKSKIKSSQQRGIRQSLQDQYPKLEPYFEQVVISLAHIHTKTHHATAMMVLHGSPMHLPLVVHFCAHAHT